MKMTWWNVYLNNRLIDEVPFDSKCDEEEVYKSLVEHNGYDSGIYIEKGEQMEEKHDYLVYRTLITNGQICENKEFVGEVRATSSSNAKELAKCYYVVGGFKNKFNVRKI